MYYNVKGFEYNGFVVINNITQWIWCEIPIAELMQYEQPWE